MPPNGQNGLANHQIEVRQHGVGAAGSGGHCESRHQVRGDELAERQSARGSCGHGTAGREEGADATREQAQGAQKVMHYVE